MQLNDLKPTCRLRILTLQVFRFAPGQSLSNLLYCQKLSKRPELLCYNINNKQNNSLEWLVITADLWLELIPMYTKITHVYLSTAEMDGLGDGGSIRRLISSQFSSVRSISAIFCSMTSFCFLSLLFLNRHLI